MAIWSVLTYHRVNDTPMQSAERVVFVRESFSVLGLLFAPLVLLRHRLWLATSIYMVLSFLFAMLTWLGVPEAVESSVMLGLHLLVALELPTLRISKLRRLGYAEAGVVVAGSRDQAERRFFTSWRPGSTPVASPSRSLLRQDAGILGALAEPRPS